jgi:uncharacterized protein YecT (DUF1311 family)
MKKITLFLLFTFLFVNFGFSQTQKDEDYIRIQKMTEQCIDANSSTQGMADCVIKEQEEWDKVLNKYYNLLKAELSEEGKTALLEAQREWLKMRDKEFAFIDQLYHVETGGGTMYIPIALSAKSEIVQKRALELKSYYKELSFE